MSLVSSPAPAPRSVGVALLPIMVAVSIAFLIIGLALPVLPLHVHLDLGLSTFVVGLVAGSQFVAALLSRVWAGHYADRSGAKRAVIAGLLTAVAGGLLYLLSLRFAAAPRASVTILLLGRLLLGGAESFIITGGVSWGLALVGPANAGKVIAWVGMAMFAALALGAPLGTMLYTLGGFETVAIATAVIPIVTILVVAPLAAIPPHRGLRPSLLKVAGAVWMPGLGSALSSIGFGTMIAFSSLLSAERQWDPVWLLFSVFAAALVVARLLLGHLPDRLGGARVALISVLIEAAGLALIWGAPSQASAAAGAVLTARWLCAGLSRAGSRSRPSGATAEPRSCHGGIYRLPRHRARFWPPCVGIDRGLGWTEFGVSRRSSGGVWCGGHRGMNGYEKNI